jgi:hypothetical protein
MASALPYIRSVVLVSLILSVSSASHVLGAGHLPSPGVLLLLGVLMLMPLTLLARRTVSFRSALLIMGTGQLILHGIFAMTAVAAVCRSSSAQPGHHAAFELACSPVALERMGSSGGAAMLLFHGVATVLLALAVSRSDAAVALLAAWLRPLLKLPVASRPVPPEERSVLPARPARVSPLSVHASVPTLRGPPRPLAPAL